MNTRVPVWVFLLSILGGALFTMLVAWSVKTTVDGDNRTGYLGKAAVAVASFPNMVSLVFDQAQEDSDGPVRVPRTDTDLSAFRPVPTPPGIEIPGLLMRTDEAALQRAAGWRFLVGAFTINDQVRNAALALSPDLRVENVWLLHEEDVEALNDTPPRPPHRKFIHGFDILDDASVIFAFDGGISLQRFDKCGVPMWSASGYYNHSVTLTEEQDFAWTLLDENLAKIRTATGEIVDTIEMADIIDANPTTDILRIRTKDDNDLGGNSRNTEEPWLFDPLHINDVDPLPPTLADRFEAFDAGDLLVSVRSLNLLFVLDPETRRIKWWRAGAVRRQHDPDWGSDGTISVYDNRLGRDYSRIVKITPASYETTVVSDGRDTQFYSRIRGKHQFTDAGTLLVTSSQQGRIFELDSDGNVILDVINTKPNSDSFNYSLSEAKWLPPDKFDSVEFETCAHPSS